jgi:hypothetical protein
MFERQRVLVASAGVAVIVSQPIQAPPIAHSIADCSATQGLGGWSYGSYNRTAGGPYTFAGFIAFDTFDGSTWRERCPGWRRQQ